VILFFFQISNIENLAKISTQKKKAKLVKFKIQKQKFPIFFVEKSRKFVGKTNNGCQYLLCHGNQPIKVFFLNFVR
jgi:hypothetical protein